MGRLDVMEELVEASGGEALSTFPTIQLLRLMVNGAGPGGTAVVATTHEAVGEGDRNKHQPYGDHCTLHITTPPSITHYHGHKGGSGGT